MTGTVVGAVGARHQVRVDARGALQPLDAAWSLGWSIGADDRWRDPAEDPTVRQQLVDAVPVVRTALRIPGGDAVEHVYGAGGAEGVVVEVANQSPAPFVLALTVRGAHRVAVDDTTVLVDGRPALRTARPAPRWAVAAGSTAEAVRSGAASSGPFPATTDRHGRLEATFLYPVAHRTTLVCLALPAVDRGAPAASVTAAGPEAAARGWRAHLDRGLLVELPDPRLVDELTAARADALLAAARASVDPLAVAALEDWGFDDEAGAAWRRLGWRARRSARRRRPGRWADVTAARRDGGAPLLLATRAFLADDTDGTVTVLPELPPDWRGQPVDIRGAPIRAGRLSYAVRWHGPRPALLWEAPAGVRVRAPGLDPSWSSAEPSGEALLAKPGA
jgi:hypothetical protein